MKILTLDNGRISIPEETLFIPEFKKLWENHKDKEKSRLELLYVYFYADYNSPYKNYGAQEREDELKRDLGISKTKDITLAIEKYKKLNYTPNMRLLEAAQYAANKTEEYFKNTDYTERDAKGNAVYKGTDVTKMLKDILGIVTSLDGLKEKIEAENLANSKTKGNVRVSKWEQT